jgi:hypothetical protein
LGKALHDNLPRDGADPELDKPDAINETRKTPAAQEPSTGSKV